ncbi:hypothetical protein FM112_07785 [Gulosibacter sp. 10]|nr:hypothetical protein FM112_07785 [Gulosibacter sp. 10]
MRYRVLPPLLPRPARRLRIPPQPTPQRQLPTMRLLRQLGRERTVRLALIREFRHVHIQLRQREHRHVTLEPLRRKLHVLPALRAGRERIRRRARARPSATRTHPNHLLDTCKAETF